MSYDVTLVIDTGGAEPAAVFFRNHTSNTAPMWRAAGADLAAMHGMPAQEAQPVLAAALNAMADDPPKFQAMNPANGWGSYETCVEFLAGLEVACLEHPKTTLRVSS